LQAGDDSLDRADDEVVCGTIQQSFGTQPQVRGQNVYFILWDAANVHNNFLIAIVWLLKLDFC
jgi:hypothetical protein